MIEKEKFLIRLYKKENQNQFSNLMGFLLEFFNQLKLIYEYAEIADRIKIVNDHSENAIPRL